MSLLSIVFSSCILLSLSLFDLLLVQGQRHGMLAGWSPVLGAVCISPQVEQQTPPSSWLMSCEVQYGVVSNYDGRTTPPSQKQMHRAITCIKWIKSINSVSWSRWIFRLLSARCGRDRQPWTLGPWSAWYYVPGALQRNICSNVSSVARALLGPAWLGLWGHHHSACTASAHLSLEYFGVVGGYWDLPLLQT